MPAGTDAIAVKDSARAFAIETFGYNHDYVFVQHLDDKHPHVHLTVRSLGHDGKRLNPRNADLQAWRERFAGELRLRGIAAEATPRRTRGRVRKAARGAVLAMRKRKITPDVDRRARNEVLSEVKSGRSAKHSWDEQIKSRQDVIRRRYLDYAAELQRSGAGALRAWTITIPRSPSTPQPGCPPRHTPRHCPRCRRRRRRRRAASCRP
ncbi:relaxase/mobilization nuclease domain-containing protein [Bradyrhizobium sp. i1.15.2]|uniref:relaxase/mobilization nuclease domain-containing protein n=1 Tax=Bradyrhizobium sp. i1.15.2 TaxID=3156362 RepID=UPI0033980716